MTVSFHHTVVMLVVQTSIENTRSTNREIWNHPVMPILFKVVSWENGICDDLCGGFSIDINDIEIS